MMHLKISFIILLFSFLNSKTINQFSVKEKTNYNGSLYVKWAGVIDNGEGDDCPHGPWGNLYVAIYPMNNSSRCPNIYSDPYHSRTVMEGPSSGKCNYVVKKVKASDEWLDGDAMRMNFPVYNWRHNNETVIMVIFESDGSSWIAPNRRHDILFCHEISRRSTVNGSQVFSDENRKAHSDAVRNCKNGRISWYRDVWSGGLRSGMPKIFVQLETS